MPNSIPQSGGADLIIAIDRVEKATFVSGSASGPDWAVIHFSVRNIGTQPATTPDGKIIASFELDGVSWLNGQLTVAAPILPGAATPSERIFIHDLGSPVAPGPHRLRLVVNPDGVVLEKRTDNNRSNEINLNVAPAR